MNHEEMEILGWTGAWGQDEASSHICFPHNGSLTHRLCQVETKPALGQGPEQGLTWKRPLLSNSNHIQTLLF